ncbi:MAG: DNA polymerase I [Crocinitomicaceae bacterium]|nr:DNA polymerase I [Crocinitomicaceae bacterium]MDG1776170.1 DNA polymerase I [Crocinitomicaceae bacterium]
MISSKHDKKLFLVDAFALIFRSYFAFAKNPRINSKGQNTSAAFGFTNALLEIIRNEKPTHLAVVFDPPGGSVSRREEFTEYKAHRDETPEGITSMIQPIKDIVKAFNIPILQVDGFEADDTIGTLSVIAEKAGFTTYMLTPDKDFAQLVTDNVFMYRPGRGGSPAEVWDTAKVLEKFDVENVKQVIDILGLQGDAADNIPGIPGIGPKTASKLLKQYGSVEGIIEHSDELKGKQKENVENFAEQGLMSKSLATIILDVDVEFNEEELTVCAPNPEKVRDVFTELEFKNLARRVLGEEIVVSSAPVMDGNGQMDLFGKQAVADEIKPTEPEAYKTIATKKHSYHLISSPEDRKELLALLMKQKKVCFDTETDRLDALHANIVGIAFSYKAHEAFYVATPNDFEEAKKIIEEFRPFFESTQIEKIAHNIKYDIKVINRYGVAVEAPTFDTMIAHYLINADSKQSMDFLSEFYLKYKPVSIETLIGKKGKNQKTMADLSPEEVYEYACEDADITFQLMELFEPEIQKEHLKELFYNMEMPLVDVLKSMEQEGITIDSEGLKNYSEELGQTLESLDVSIKKEAGIDFNIDSPKQLGEVLFDHMQISSKAKKTKTGQYATGEDVLQKLKHTHAIIPMILDYRQLRKLKNTYVDPLPSLMDEVDGRIHTSYMQTVAATGRLSSNNPNLQNIPIRSDKGKEIRKSFISRGKGFQLMAADYSQIELRIIAALSEDDNMIEAFRTGVDIHKATAAKVFSVALEDVTRDQRSSAKAVNFGIIYGQSAFGLAQNLNISRKEAKQIIDSYFEQYPTIRGYMDAAVVKAREDGYVETIMKRRRYLKDINSANAVVRGFAERNAVNAPIQGSAADVIKLAMIGVHGAMKEANLKSKMLLQVHDELVFDVHETEVELMQDLVKREMESAVELAVPMEVEMKVADNWLDAH